MNFRSAVSPSAWLKSAPSKFKLVDRCKVSRAWLPTCLFTMLSRFWSNWSSTCSLPVQRGHLPWFLLNQSSKHDLWKECWQGRVARLSPRLYDASQTAHSMSFISTVGGVYMPKAQSLEEEGDYSEGENWTSYGSFEYSLESWKPSERASAVGRTLSVFSSSVASSSTQTRRLGDRPVNARSCSGGNFTFSSLTSLTYSCIWLAMSSLRDHLFSKLSRLRAD